MRIARFYAVLVTFLLSTAETYALDVPPDVLAEIQAQVGRVVSDAIGTGTSGDFGPADNQHWRVSFGQRGVTFPQPLAITCNDGQSCEALFSSLSERFTITTTLPLRIRLKGTFKAWGWAITDIDGDFDLDKTLHVSVTMPVQWTNGRPVPLPDEGMVLLQVQGGNVDVSGLIGEGIAIGAVTSVIAPWSIGLGGALGAIGATVAEGKIESAINKRFKSALSAAATEQSESLLQLAADQYSRVIDLAVAALLGMFPSGS